MALATMPHHCVFHRFIGRKQDSPLLYAFRINSPFLFIICAPFWLKITPGTYNTFINVTSQSLYYKRTVLTPSAWILLFPGKRMFSWCILKFENNSLLQHICEETALSIHQQFESKNWLSSAAEIKEFLLPSCKSIAGLHWDA